MKNILLAGSLTANVIVWIRLSLVRWHAEQDRDSAYRQGRREGWYDAARHIPVDRNRNSNNIWN